MLGRGCTGESPESAAYPPRDCARRTGRLTGPWACHRCAECCRTLAGIVLTPDELRLLAAARPEVSVRAEPYHGAAGFLYLHARPCPYLRSTGYCDVYAIRPYNCRRYLCGRADPEHEPLTNDSVPEVVLKTRALRRQYVKGQRHAQKWAKAHGWPTS